MVSKVFPLSARTQSTSLKQPKELISYSRVQNGEYIIENSKPSYFYFPDTELDKQYNLQSGFKNFKKFDDKGEMKGFLNAIKKWEEIQLNALISDLEKKVIKDDETKLRRAKKCKVDGNVIAFRGLMTKLLTLPYFSEEELEINAMYFDGQIFLKANEESESLKKITQEAQQLQRGQTKEMIDKLTYSGYKFEKLVTLNKPWADCTRDEIEKRDKETVDTSEQYLSVVKTGIEKTKLVLGGEVDCVFDYKPDPNDVYLGKDNVLNHYMELKTSKIVNNDGQAINFEKKLYKTWAQCFLLGIPRIIYGFRDDELFLKSIEEFRTENIPIILKESPFPRNPNNPRHRKINCVESLKWFGAVLDWINQVIPKDVKDLDDQSKLVYRIKFNKVSMNFSVLGDSEIQRIIENEPVITKEFVDWRKQLVKQLDV